MKYRTTFILLGLLLLVGAYFVWVEQPAHLLTPEEQATLVEEARQGQPVFSTPLPEPKEFSALTIQHKDDPDPIEITRQDKDWFQTQPVRYPLNGYSVDQILDDVAELRYFEQFTPGMDGYPTLEQTGLEPPLVTLTLRAKDSTTTRQPIIHFGRPSVSGRVYALVEGDPHVYLVRDDLRSALDRDRLLEARRRSLDVPTAGQLRSMSLKLSDKSLSISKSDTEWSFDAPLAGRVNADAVRKITAAIRDATPAAFEADNPDDLTPFGLTNPEFAFRLVANPPVDDQVATPKLDSNSETAPVETTSQEPLVVQPNGSSETPALLPTATTPQSPSTQIHTLFIGAPIDLNKEHYYAAWTQGDEPITVVFTLPKADVQPLTLTVDDLRDPTLCDLGSPDVRELTVLRQNMEPIQLIRDPDGWSFATEPAPSTQHPPDTPNAPNAPDSPGSPGRSPPDTSTQPHSTAYDADDGLASTLLDTITETRAVSYLPGFKPTAPPLAAVRMRGIGRSDVQNIDLYADADPQYLIALNASETTGYRIAAEPLQGLFAPVILLRDRTVLNLLPEEIIQLIIQNSDGRRYVFNRQPVDAPADGTAAPPTSQPTATRPGPWHLVSADRFESAAFDAFLKAWLPLHAETWLAQPPSDPPHDLTTFMLTTTDGTTHQINVDAAAGQGFVEGQAGWFELPPAMIAGLIQEFRGRTVLNLKPQDIQSITLADVGSNRVWNLERDAAGRLAPSDPNQKTNPTAIAQLTDALSGLRVERYLETALAATTAPITTLTITTTNGHKHTLSLYTGGDSQAEQVLVNVDGRWCALAREKLDKLRAPLNPPPSTPRPRDPTAE